MKNYTYGKNVLFGLLVLIMITGKLKSQSEILGHTYLGTYNGHTYYMSDCPTSWYDALFAAEEMGGYLAAITSQEEDEFLAPFAPMIECLSIFQGYDGDMRYRIGGAWIGLLTNDNDQDGICSISSWSNGEVLGYTNWFYPPFEPISGCGPAGIIGYTGGNDYHVCTYQEYGWFTNYDANPTSRYIVEFDQDPACSQANKTYVCHNGMTLCINESSLQNHLDHGDYAGPCSPCNSNLVQFMDGNIPITAGNHIAEKETIYNPDQYGKDKVILLYPNPGQDEIKIELPPSFTNGVLKIFAIRGEEIVKYNVTTGGITHLDISSFPSGMYVVELRSEDEYWQKKFVKAQ